MPNTSPTDLFNLVEYLIPAVRMAGSVIMGVYRSQLTVSEKSDGSPVTVADKNAEIIILDTLKKVAPSAAIISEESSQNHHVVAPSRFFLIDPLDGTKEFVERDQKGSFTVNVALIESGEPVMGIVYAPALDRLFTGMSGVGSREHSGGEVKKLTGHPPMTLPLTAVVSKAHRDTETDAWLYRNDFRNVISIGSSLKLCSAATGEADAYPRFGPTMEWDTAAGDAILRAAGCRMQRSDGGQLRYGKPGYKNGAFIAMGRRWS